MLKIKLCRVHDHAVLCRLERGDGAVHVVIVTQPLLLENLLVGFSRAARGKLQKTALCAFFGRCRKVDLDLGVRQNDCADVASVHDHTVPARKLALHFQQERPHGGQSGYIGCVKRNIRQTDIRRHILSV